MKNLISLLVGLLIPSSSFAADKIIDLIRCEGQKFARYQGFTSKIYLNIDRLKLKDDTSAEIAAFDMTIINDSGKYEGLIPNVNSGALQGETIKNVPYNGKNYPGHLKFPIGPFEDGVQLSGGLYLQHSDLILAPNYTVVKSVPQPNHWDQSRKWTLEVRKHSAVLDINFNDHHGDYIKIDCYSSEVVEDKRP